ncbi:hypothetical protein CLOP_g12263 [Closterium sp. NIES-67]|nr:hypothetical protein CLOP_g12263 [Closterium sp. NIES-67]
MCESWIYVPSRLSSSSVASRNRQPRVIRRYTPGVASPLVLGWGGGVVRSPGRFNGGFQFSPASTRRNSSVSGEQQPYVSVATPSTFTKVSRSSYRSRFLPCISAAIHPVPFRAVGSRVEMGSVTVTSQTHTAPESGHRRVMSARRWAVSGK